MKITILCVGKLKEPYWKNAVKEYSTRLSAYCRIETDEVADERCPAKPFEKEILKVKEAEGDRLLKKIPEGATVFILDLKGKQMSSEELAGKMETLSINGESDIVFVIGGSVGLDSRVIARGNFKLSFSKFTFPHQLMRVILLEQIYRSFKIIKKEPYHK